MEMDDLEQKAMIPLPSAGRLLGLSRKTTYHWHSEGRFPIPVVRIGRRLLIRRDQMNGYLDTITHEAEARFAESRQDQVEPLPPETQPEARRGPGRRRLGSATGGT